MDCEAARRDISIYVNDVLAEKLENGDLVVGSADLVQELQRALIEGANGM